MPQIQAGKLRASGHRVAGNIDAIKDVPTFSDAGFPGAGNQPVWYGLLAPGHVDGSREQAAMTPPSWR